MALVGGAGVGKSRVRWTGSPGPTIRRDGWCWKVPRCPRARPRRTFRSSTCYGAIAIWKEQDEARTIRAKVTGQLLTLDEALQDTLPALLALLEVPAEDAPAGA